MKRLLITIAALLASTSVAHAQGSVDAESVYLGTSGGTICRLRVGSGSPEGAVTGSVCHWYIDTSTGEVYQKTSGAGNTGWSRAYRVGGADVSVADGGTGASSLTSNGVLYGNGTSAIQATSQGGSNTVLTANGGAPSFSATPTVTSLTATSSVSTPTLTHSGSLTISPTGDLITDPGGNDILPNLNYDINIGHLTKKYATLHAAELWVETLVAQDVLATIGGRIVVAPTTYLVQDLAAGGGNNTIHVKHNNLANGDRVLMEADGKVEWMSVDSGASGSAGDYTYTVTRGLDGASNDWYAGDAMVNTGTTGDGFIDLYSVAGVISGFGPTIVGNVRTSGTYNAVEPRWAIGNLNALYGYATDTYGAAFGSPSAAWIKIDPTNGVRIGHNTTTNAQIDASGNASFATGNITLNQNGIFIAPGTTAGSILGNDASRSYSFTVPTGQVGLYGFDATASGAYRGASLVSVWGGSGTKTQTIDIAAVDSNTLLGTAWISLTGTGTSNASTMILQADTITLQGGSLDSLNVNVVGPVSVKPNAVADGLFRVYDASANSIGSFGLSGAIKGTSATNVAFYAESGKSMTWMVNGSSTDRMTLDSTTLTVNGIVSVTAAAGSDAVRFNPGGSGNIGQIGTSGSFLGTSATNLALAAESGKSIQFYANGSGTLAATIDTNLDLIAGSDNARNLGVPSVRWALVRGVTITSGDLCFENGWCITESDKLGIAEDGLGFVRPDGELVAFIGASGLRRKGAGAGQATNIDELPYTRSTSAERAEMDAHPEQRRKTVTEPVLDEATGRPVLDDNGKPMTRTREVPKTAADVRPMPDPSKGETNAQRKAKAAQKPGGQL